MIPIILLFLIFASLHSITASGKFKQACKELFGEIFIRVYYRALYNLFGAITFGAVLYLIPQVPDQEVWIAPSWLKWIMHFIQFAVLVFGARSFEYLDTGEFLGIKQVGRYIFRGEVSGNIEGLTERGLVTTGVYGIVRHPMYLAGLVIVIFNPILTINGLTFTVLAGLYFLFGMFIEERRFVESFGDQYREYMKQVPMLIPRMRFPGKLGKKPER
jgi:uncharacterized membrane protein